MHALVGEVLSEVGSLSVGCLGSLDLMLFGFVSFLLLMVVSIFGITRRMRINVIFGVVGWQKTTQRFRETEPASFGIEALQQQQIMMPSSWLVEEGKWKDLKNKSKPKGLEHLKCTVRVDFVGSICLFWAFHFLNGRMNSYADLNEICHRAEVELHHQCLCPVSFVTGGISLVREARALLV